MRFGKCSLLSIVTAGLFVGTSAHAATHYVEKFGTDNAECSKKNPCLTIQSALFVAAPNAKIIVGPGIYEESLNIVKDGQKLEATGGMHATRIDATGDLGTPAIAVSAHKVSIGKKKGKGFEIVALNAPGVYAGEYLPDSCEYGGTWEDADGVEHDWYYPTGNFNPISNFRLEGNSITTQVNSNDAPVPYGKWCEDDTGDLKTLDILPGVYVFGSGAQIASNTITSQGTNGVIMANPQSKYLFQDNVVRHQPYMNWSDPIFGRWNYGGFTQIGSWGVTGTIKGNNLASTGSPYGTGIFIDYTWSAIKIQGNAIKGFELGVDAAGSKTSVDKNIITDVSWAGVFSGQLKSIKDNVIQGVSFLALREGIRHFPDWNSSKVDIKGNNISNFAFEGIYVGEILAQKTSTWIISNNNLYNVGVDVYGCGIFISSTMDKVKLSKNFYGDMTDLPDVLESDELDWYDGAEDAATGPGVAICAGDGRVDDAPALGTVYGSLSAKPSLKPNKIKAKFQQDVMISGNL